LNSANHTYYFTGRSDNFDPSRLSTNPLDARFDPESIRVTHDGAKVFVSDEYGPYIYRFNRKTGQRTDVITVPDSFAVANLSANGDDEISGNTSGWVALLVLIPFVNLLFWLIPGTDGPNRFGAPPPPNTTGTIVLALILPLVFVVGIVAVVAIPAYQTYAQRAQMHQQ